MKTMPTKLTPEDKKTLEWAKKHRQTYETISAIIIVISFLLINGGVSYYLNVSVLPTFTASTPWQTGFFFELGILLSIGIANYLIFRNRKDAVVTAVTAVAAAVTAVAVTVAAVIAVAVTAAAVTAVAAAVTAVAAVAAVAVAAVIAVLMSEE